MITAKGFITNEFEVWLQPKNCFWNVAEPNGYNHDHTMYGVFVSCTITCMYNHVKRLIPTPTICLRSNKWREELAQCDSKWGILTIPDRQPTETWDGWTKGPQCIPVMCPLQPQPSQVAFAKDHQQVVKQCAHLGSPQSINILGGQPPN